MRTHKISKYLCPASPPPPPSAEEVPLHRRAFVIMDEIDEDKEKELEAAIKIES